MLMNRFGADALRFLDLRGQWQKIAVAREEGARMGLLRTVLLMRSRSFSAPLAAPRLFFARAAGADGARVFAAMAG